MYNGLESNQYAGQISGNIKQHGNKFSDSKGKFQNFYESKSTVV